MKNRPTWIMDLLRSSKEKGKTLLAVLLDPDKLKLSDIPAVLANISSAPADVIMIGGSLLSSDLMERMIEEIKKQSSLPILIFPGSPAQISDKADGILLLSLISGRNPELLIGQHVVAAPSLHRSSLEIISNGYLLIDGGAPTTVSYMSQTAPIPRNKPEIAVATCIAGELLGLQSLYLDAGSGADTAIPPEMIAGVRENSSLPLIVGGGIRTAQAAYDAATAGADLIVIGTAFENDPLLIREIANAINTSNKIHH